MPTALSPLVLTLASPPTAEAIELRRAEVAQLRTRYRPQPVRWLLSAVLLGAVWSYPLLAGVKALIPAGMAACVVAVGYCVLAWQANAVLSISHALRLEATYLSDLGRKHCADMRALCAAYPEAEIYRLKVIHQGRLFINADFELLNTLPEQQGEDAFEAACKALYSIPA